MSHLKTWDKLKQHYETIGKDLDLVQLFSTDANRFDNLNATFGTIGSSSLPLLLLDYSKNLVTQDTMNLLFDLVREAQVESWRDKMFHGEKINSTEKRAVLVPFFSLLHDLTYMMCSTLLYEIKVILLFLWMEIMSCLM